MAASGGLVDLDAEVLGSLLGEPQPLENSALATAASFNDLTVHARGRIDKESASGVVNDATALAANVSHWVATGPGSGSFDLDVAIGFDGILDVAGEAFHSSAFPSQRLAVGETFAIAIEIETVAAGTGVWEGGFGVLADFFDTGSFALSTETEGVSLQSVPEPDGASLTFAALLALALRGSGRAVRRRPAG